MGYFNYKRLYDNHYLSKDIESIHELPVGTWYISCPREELTSLPDFKYLVNLEEVYCNNNSLSILPNWETLVNLRKLWCFENKLTILPNWENLTKLEIIECYTNNLTSLPNWKNLINLICIRCHNNNLTSLPNWENLINLSVIDCSHNKLMSLPNWENLINLSVIDCSYDLLTSLPNWETLVNLKKINCSCNRLTLLPNWDTLINLEHIDCMINKLTALPSQFGMFNRLTSFYYSGNPYEYYPPNVLRMIRNLKTKKNIYEDTQSVHDHNIQLSLKKNIIRLLETKPTLKMKECIIEIERDVICHELITKYIKDASIHSLLNVTFGEVLLCVWTRIKTSTHRDEIIKILNIEMLDSECKCFTGRLTRLVNCLVCFESDITMEINESDQMSNISQLLYKKYPNNEDYQREIRKEFLERGYSEQDILNWINI